MVAPEISDILWPLMQHWSKYTELLFFTSVSGDKIIKFLKFLRETETHFTSRHSFYDDFRYINFSRTLVNEGNGFDIRDGIFRVPVTGLYMFTVHALPMEDRPFMVQIHLNDQSVAAFSNGESGTFPFG